MPARFVERDEEWMIKKLLLDVNIGWVRVGGWRARGELPVCIWFKTEASGIPHFCFFPNWSVSCMLYLNWSAILKMLCAPSPFNPVALKRLGNASLQCKYSRAFTSSYNHKFPCDTFKHCSACLNHNNDCSSIGAALNSHALKGVKGYLMFNERHAESNLVHGEHFTIRVQ